MPQYTVKQGDCISSIADRYGLFWEQVWNHPSNSGLKANRRDPNVLRPGDLVYVPDKREKTEAGATDQLHRFRKKGVPAKLRLRLLDEDEPLANQPYSFEIDGRTYSGTTDSDGRIEQSIPPGARQGKLIVGESRDEYMLDLGHIDPISEISGVQARLNNLGYDCGAADGVVGPRTRTAIREFQRALGLRETGEADDQTRRRLEQEYGV
ncbi:MAG: peptidoglycan-binding protein [Acidobacteriota bacterium]